MEEGREGEPSFVFLFPLPRSTRKRVLSVFFSFFSLFPSFFVHRQTYPVIVKGLPSTPISCEPLVETGLSTATRGEVGGGVVGVIVGGAAVSGGGVNEGSTKMAGNRSDDGAGAGAGVEEESGAGLSPSLSALAAASE